jgi:anti-sigma regulatory factor (Ser/Thr protein kinase)
LPPLTHKEALLGQNGVVSHHAAETRREIPAFLAVEGRPFVLRDTDCYLLNRPDAQALEVPSADDKLTIARSFTHQALARWQLAELADDALLAVSELVTNAVLHGRGPVTLLLERQDGGIRVEVHDHSSQMPQTTAASQLRTSGRGLAIVAAIAHSWGAHQLRAGKVVWAEVARK